MQLFLEVLTGSRAGRTQPLPRDKSIYVGRQETAHVCIADDTLMALTHFAVDNDSRGYRVRDLSSRGGTFVNGAKVSEKIVGTGDQIKAGNTTFLLRVAMAADAAPAPVAAPPSMTVTMHGPLRKVSPRPQPAPAPAAGAFFPAYSTKLLELHAEELEFLWAQRQSILRSPLRFRYDLAALEERIEAHVQGLLVAGAEMLPLMAPGLDADEPFPVFLAAYPLLRLGTEPAVQRVLFNFVTAKEGKLDGLRQALCYAGLPALNPLQKALTNAPAAAAVAAAEILAFHGRLEIQAAQFDVFLKHKDPLIRTAAWRTMARANIPTRPGAFQAGLGDSDPQVKRETLWAAAWQAQTGLLDYCRQLALTPTAEQWDGIYLLAILGTPEDLDLMLEVAQAPKLGPLRFEAVAAFGHPALVEILLTGLESSDIPTAVASAQAFTRITGLDIESNERVQVPPADGHQPDEFEKEFLDEVQLPNRQLAREHWKKEAARYRQGTRWSRGLNLSGRLPPQAQDSLDLKARWEARLRGKVQGTWKGNISDLEVFPQKTS
jgi:uncharacterized protein (TIGR02270 family)